MEFKASKSPYAACKFILENSKLDYVMFQAAGAIKEAVVREWSLLADDDVKSLRNYLLQYVTQRPELQGYVREQVLQAVAVIFKRGSLQTTQGADHEQLMSDVTGLIGTGNPSMQSLGCSILMALMNEYSTTTHSSSIGLSWEFHLTAKRTFETRDLKRVFQLCVQVLQQLESMTVAPSRDVVVLINKFLAITEQVLSWRFTAYNLPGRFALVMENSQSCALMPGPAWRDILMDPAIVQFFFRIHDKVRSNPELAHHTLQCLCQLASIRGTVFNNDEMKVAYLKNYLQCYILLISREDIAECEVLGVATAISRLALFFPVAFFANMPEEIGKHLKVALTKLSCQFCRLAAQQQGVSASSLLMILALIL
ncbi:PREDICTED: exportin-4-like, partial [Priapulus caudatus]|uniref:Exportin-4 n=1 Tax=Priapulus caudatus TaxID=37621 RepID=A0ABM1F5K3_PRICU